MGFNSGFKGLMQPTYSLLFIYLITTLRKVTEVCNRWCYSYGFKSHRTQVKSSTFWKLHKILSAIYRIGKRYFNGCEPQKGARSIIHSYSTNLAALTAIRPYRSDGSLQAFHIAEKLNFGTSAFIRFPNSNNW